MLHKIKFNSESIYDWIDNGWASNHVSFSATAAITYLIAVGPSPERYRTLPVKDGRF